MKSFKFRLISLIAILLACTNLHAQSIGSPGSTVVVLGKLAVKKTDTLSSDPTMVMVKKGDTVAVYPFSSFGSGSGSNVFIDSTVISCDGLHPTISFPLSHTGYKSVHFEFEDERALTPSEADDGINGFLSWQASKKGLFKVYELYNY